MFNPHDLGFPDSIGSFRDAQSEAIEYALTSERRFTCLGAPPGCGKSAIAYALAKLFGGRTYILTANLGLMQQYMQLLGPVGLVDIQGRRNYQCWEGGTCEDGGRLGCKDKVDCPALIAYARQDASEIVVSNYAYWLAVHDKGRGVRACDTLICDEAALCPGILSQALDFYITERECKEAKVSLGNPSPGEDIDVWIARAASLQAGAEARYTSLKASAGYARGYSREKLMKELRHAESFVDRTAKLSRVAPDNWVCSRIDGSDIGRLWRFECVWPGQYKERLFRNIPRVILMSAVLRPKTMQWLGIKAVDYDFREWGRQFPAANGPVVWVPTARVGHRMSDEDKGMWLARNREIFEWGSDRNGLVHTVSFARSREIAEQAGDGTRGKLHLNGAADPDSTPAREVYQRFIGATEPGVLISPSFSTGWDFKYKASEWQTIAKIAFPDTRSKVMQARLVRDKGYGNSIAAQDLVQACGRIVRDYDDRGTTLLIDNNWAWFKNAASEDFPRWFKVRREERLPPPLPKL